MKNKRLVTVLLTAIFCMLNIGGSFPNLGIRASADSSSVQSFGNAYFPVCCKIDCSGASKLIVNAITDTDSFMGCWDYTENYTTQNYFTENVADGKASIVFWVPEGVNVVYLNILYPVSFRIESIERFSDSELQTSISTPTATVLYSGKCGENLTWTLDDEGVLTISGTGLMMDWNSSYDRPWSNQTSDIKKVVIADGVTSIGRNAFSSLSNLTFVTIPNSVASIGDSAFFNCTGLYGITIPDRVTSIGLSVFEGCRNLTKVAIPNSITHIGANAFMETGLTEVTIPDSVTNIEEQAFLRCTRLTEITIPDHVESIGRQAFQECESLKEISILNPECTIFDKEYTISDTAVIYGYEDSTAKGYAEKYSRTFVPMEFINAFVGFGVCSGEEDGTALWRLDKEGALTITGEGSAAHGSWDDFAADIRNVIIEPGITSIQSSVFSGCTGLKNIAIPEGVTSIGESAFSGCTGMTSVTLPESVTDIGASAFSGCTGMTSITLPEGIDTIPESLFSKCTGLKEIIIPNNIRYIAPKAFEYCSGLKEVTILNPGCIINSIPGTVLIHGYADSTAEKYADDNGNSFEPLENCGDNLTWTLDDEGTLTISGTGKMYDLNVEYLPCNKKDVRSIIIEPGVTSIGGAAFGGCSNLTSISIPTSVESIGRSAFDDCDSLSSIIIPAGVKEIGEYAFSGCRSLKSVSIPESVESIGEGAFSFCFSLTTVELPDSITSIERSVFSSCHNLASITIPESVTNISNDAFSGSDSLKDVTVLNPSCRIEEECFLDSIFSSEELVFHGYPGSAIEAYAERYKCPFRSVSEEALRGDVNDDAKVNAKDAQYVLIAYTESLTTGIINLNEEETAAADVDGSGKVTVADAQYILLYYVQNEVAGTPTTWEDLIA